MVKQNFFRQTWIRNSPPAAGRRKIDCKKAKTDRNLSLVTSATSGAKICSRDWSAKDGEAAKGAKPSIKTSSTAAAFNCRPSSHHPRVLDTFTHKSACTQLCTFQGNIFWAQNVCRQLSGAPKEHFRSQDEVGQVCVSVSWLQMSCRSRPRWARAHLEPLTAPDVMLMSVLLSERKSWKVESESGLNCKAYSHPYK